MRHKAEQCDTDRNKRYSRRRGSGTERNHMYHQLGLFMLNKRMAKGQMEMEREDTVLTVDIGEPVSLMHVCLCKWWVNMLKTF